MNWTLKEIRLAFNGRLMGKSRMKSIVCKAVSYLPYKIVGYVTQNIWFVSSPQDSWAFTLRGSDIKNQYVVVLSDDLLMQEDSQVIYTILHEIGHVTLGHRNSMGFEQTQTEIKNQEIEADKFAYKYINKPRNTTETISK